MFPEKGILVPYIKDYLEGEGRELNEVVLKEFGNDTVKAALQDFMKERSPRKGSYGAARTTKPACSNYYNFMGIPGLPFDWETQLKLFTGKMIEASFLLVAKLALEGTPHDIGLNNAYLDVPIGTRGKLPGEAGEGEREKDKIKGFVDGLISFDHIYHRERFGIDLRPSVARDIKTETLVLEIKSAGSYPFKLFCEGNPRTGEKPGPNDLFGYKGQVSSYQRALKLPRYDLVYIDKDTNRIAEWLGSFEKQYTKKADQIYDAVMDAAAQGKPPEPPPECQPIQARGGLEAPFVCNFCSWVEVCAEDRGLVAEAKEVKGFQGKKKTIYKLIKIGAGQPQAKPLFDVDEAVETAVSESTYSR